jgi:hypothetical protein
MLTLAKICTHCKLEKDASNFTAHKETKDKLASWCKSCSKEAAINSCHKSLEHKAKHLVRSCKNSAKKRKQEITITAKDFLSQWKKQNGKCYYTGVELALLPHLNNTVSVDRVDNTVGYLPSNIVLCCHVINEMKSAMLLEDFLKFCDLVSKHEPNRT